MNRISDFEFMRALHLYIAQHTGRFRVRPTVSVAQHTFTISDRCCRIVLWQTPLGFEYRLLSRPDRRLLAFGECPRLDQALDEAVALMSTHEGQALPRTALTEE